MALLAAPFLGAKLIESDYPLLMTSVAPSALSARERYAGMLEASLVADSLALAPHWIYDQDELEQKFGRITDLEAPPLDGYHAGKKLGDQTHYGDQMLVVMESLEACGGNFVMDDFARRWRAYWKSSTSYRDHATKDTLAHLESGKGLTQAGSDSTELGGPGRIAPLLLALRNDDAPVIIGAARAQTALTHASLLAVDAAEFITRAVLLLMRGVSIPSALRTTATLPYKALPAADYFQQAEAVLSLSTSDAVESLGQSCPLEKALPATFAILLKHGESLETALIENVMAGGDSAARGVVLGMILGAAHGQRSIPTRWLEGLQARSRVASFLRMAGIGEALTTPLPDVVGSRH